MEINIEKIMEDIRTEIKEKGYSLSAGQYFDIKIDYVDITEEEFNAKKKQLLGL